MQELFKLEPNRTYSALMEIVWQQGSSNSENPNYLATISQWWTNLTTKDITWQQRIIPQNAKVEQLDWEPKRFEKIFAIALPEIRGINLYWYKPDSPQERNTTPHQLILDNFHQYLYIFPQSQKQLVIRVGLPSISYETISIINLEYSYNPSAEKYILTL